MNNPTVALLAALLLSQPSASVAYAASQDAWLVERGTEMGIDFVHTDARTGDKFYTETAASGGALLDFDQDGDLDIYLVNGASQPGWRNPDGRELINRLYENRGGRFHDVTAERGVGDAGYGMGVCAGDVDGNGRIDFMVTNFGADRLFVNRGDGSFSERAEGAGVAEQRWSASCAFGDLDGDGDHDLYVTHYVDFRYDNNPFCGDRARNLRAYCRPSAFRGVSDSLFINQGDGRFREEGAARGILQGKEEKGFGVVLEDFDDDGDLDIYVANDGTENRLYRNDGKGRFEDVGLFAGVALSRMGRAESGMGVAAGDIDADGRVDLLVTNYSMETNTLYRNLGELSFDDLSQKRGLSDDSYPFVGWGTALLDVDNDRDLDLAVVNGHAIDNIEIFEAGLQYAQPNLLWLNDGTGHFSEAGNQTGSAWRTPKVSRGLAQGDLDGDGRLDLLVTNTNDRPDVLFNRHPGSGRWLGVELDAGPRRPLPLGARVELTVAGVTLVRTVHSGGSFLTQSDLRLHFGLGDVPPKAKVELRIRWPDGALETRTADELDRYWTISRRNP